MQNTSFVYHPECLIEMQMMCLLIVFYYSNRQVLSNQDITWTKVFGDDSHSQNYILLGIMVEHVLSYLVAYFRKYDIEKNGKIDINGVKRATTESFIGNVQFFIACILIGFSVNYFLGK